MADALGPGVFQAFINWLFSSGDISVPTEYHERCQKVNNMLDDDVFKEVKDYVKKLKKYMSDF